jgi:hypothetical protein
MGTQRVQMKGVWLARWARHASKIDFYPALAALVRQVQSIFSLTVNYILIYVSQQPAAWTGSRAGPPVSECVCLIDVMNLFLQFCNKVSKSCACKKFL